MLLAVGQGDLGGVNGLILGSGEASPDLARFQVICSRRAMLRAASLSEGHRVLTSGPPGDHYRSRANGYAYR